MKQKKNPATKDLRALKAVGVAGLRHHAFGEMKQSKTLTGSARICYSTLDDEELPVGTVARLTREPENLFDRDAIALFEEASGRKMGYVPSGQNKTLSRLMDAGFPLYGVVLSHNRQAPISDPNRITVAVYIERYKAVRK